jgi:hypothetical protein
MAEFRRPDPRPRVRIGAVLSVYRETEMKRAIRPVAYLAAGLFFGFLGGALVAGAVDALAQSKTTVQIDAQSKQQIKQELKVELMQEMARTRTTQTSAPCDCNTLQQQYRALERLYREQNDVLKDLWRQVQDHERDDAAWKKNTDRVLTKLGAGKVRQN